MTPDVLFAADEDRQIRSSRALRSMFGYDVRMLTPEEAAVAVVNAERCIGIRANGHCHACGCGVPGKRLYCDEHKAMRRAETSRRYQGGDAV